MHDTVPTTPTKPACRGRDHQRRGAGSLLFLLSNPTVEFGPSIASQPPLVASWRCERKWRRRSKNTLAGYVFFTLRRHNCQSEGFVEGFWQGQGKGQRG